MFKYLLIFSCLTSMMFCHTAFATYCNSGPTYLCNNGEFCVIDSPGPDESGTCWGCWSPAADATFISHGGVVQNNSYNRLCSWFLYQEANYEWQKITSGTTERWERVQCPDHKISPDGYIVYYSGTVTDTSYLPAETFNGMSQGQYYFIQMIDGHLQPYVSGIPECVSAPYKVTVNCADSRTSNHTYCNTDLYRQYDNKVDWFYDYDDVSVGNKITTNLEIPTKNCAVFNGFYDTNNTMVFSATGVSQTTADNPIITGPTTITAQWTPAQYTLQINNINNATSNCTCGQNCAIPAYTNCTPGKYVSAITVLDDCGTIADGVFTPSATCQIQDGGQIILTATVDNCPAGYYCTECQKHQCTDGKTSDGGTTATGPEACYYGAGTTYTDTYGGSFTLPVKITVVSQN